MAGDRRFMNFLYPKPIAGQRNYRGLNRLICEFITQVLGWTLHDTDGSAEWTAVVDSGASADTTASPDTLDMTGSGRVWSAADEDFLLTLTGISGVTADEEQGNGIYRIKSVVDANTIKVDIQRGVHSSGLPNGYTNLNWRLWDPSSVTYNPAAGDWAVYRAAYSHTPAEPNFDIYHKVGPDDNTYQFIPRFAIGPYGTWDNVGHAWSDGRNTSSKIMAALGSPSTGYGVASCFACGDDDHVWFWWNHGVNTNVWHNLGLGQIIDPFYPASDTNPGAILFAGTGMTFNYPHILLGRDSGGGFWASSIYMLADDDSTTVAGRLMVPSCGARDDGTHSVMNIWEGSKRRVSRWSTNYLRADILIQSRTTTHWEVRGKLIDMAVGGAYPPFGRPFGDPTDPPYIQIFGGMSHPWHGSDVFYVPPYTFDWTTI